VPTGVIVLLVVAILVYFGLLHRVLDRMRLDDRTALFIVFLMVLGSFFNLTLLRRPPLTVNIGGAIIPIGIAVYLVSTADTSREKIRGTLAAVISGAVIYLSMKLLNPEEQTMIIDPSYFFALIAGVVGYLSGRSRRSAFIAGTMGVVLADVAHYVEISVRGIPGRTWIGGAGAFDAVVIAGVLAVGLAEVVGETREYMARGPLKGGPGTRRGGDGERSGDGPDGDEHGGGREHGGGGREHAEASEKAENRESDPGDGFVAAFGVGGGSGRGGRSRDSHRAGRAGRSRGDPRARPVTSGGAGWGPPIVGDSGGAEGGAGDLTGVEMASKAQTPATSGGVTGPTEPATSLAPGTGIDLTDRYGSPQTGRSGRGKSKAGSGGKDRTGGGHGPKGGEVND